MVKGLCGIAALLAGCGGSVILVEGVDGGSDAAGPPSSQGGDDAAPTASGGSSGSGSGSGGPVFDPCPPNPPVPGSTCPEPGLGCMYDTGNGVCVGAFVCEGGGQWVPVSC
jgi:hypothetical protein